MSAKEWNFREAINRLYEYKGGSVLIEEVDAEFDEFITRLKVQPIKDGEEVIAYIISKKTFDELAGKELT